MMPAHSPHQSRGKCDRRKPDQYASRTQDQARAVFEVRIFLQGEQRKIECRMQAYRSGEHENPARDARPITVMAMGAERGARPGDCKVGARDNAKRAMKWYRQNTPQRSQRLPHVGVLNEVGEIFVSGKAKAGGRAVNHGFHRIGERPPPGRHHGYDQNLDCFLRQRDAKERMKGLSSPRVLRGCEEGHEGIADRPQYRNARGTEKEGRPYFDGWPRSFAGSYNKP